jgi:hypothetical protein
MAVYMRRIIYKKILFTGIFLLTLISMSYSAEWELYATDCYYDKGNIKHIPNNIIRVWTKCICSDTWKEEIIKELGESLKDAKESLSLIQINCNEKIYSILDVIFYDSKGSVIASSTSTEKERFVPPDSGIEKLYKIVCEKSK